MDDHRDPVTAILYRDPAASIMFGVALFLIVLNLTAAFVVAHKGRAYIGLMEVGMVLTGAFAVVGMVFGLVRGLRVGRALKRPRV